MLALFRTNQFVANSLLIIYALILRGAVFFQSGEWLPPQHSILSEWMYQWLGTNTTAASIMAIVLVIFQALLINILVSEQRIADEVTLFPGLFYILLASSVPHFLFLSPLLMANTFYILAIKELYHTYKKPASSGRIYNAGLWIGIASLFYFSYLIFFLFGFIALGVLRAFNLRERLMLLFGSATPYLLLGTLSFWQDRWAIFWQQQFTENLGLLDFNFTTAKSSLYIALGGFSLLLLMVFLSYSSYVLKKNIQKQKYINLLYWGLFIAGFTVLIQAGIDIEHLLILVPPLAILLSFNFLNFKSSLAESLHFLMLFVVLLFQLKFWSLI